MTDNRFSVRASFKRIKANGKAMLHRGTEPLASSSTASAPHSNTENSPYCRTFSDIDSGLSCKYERMQGCRANGCSFCDLILNGLAAMTQGRPSDVVLGMDEYGSTLRARVQPKNAASINVEFHRTLDRKESDS